MKNFAEDAWSYGTLKKQINEGITLALELGLQTSWNL